MIGAALRSSCSSLSRESESGDSHPQESLAYRVHSGRAAYVKSRQTKPSVPGHRRTTFSLEGRRPRRHGKPDVPRAGREVAAAWGRQAMRARGQVVRAGSLCGAADLSGHGRGREGRHDQTRDVRRQPAELPGVLVQDPVVRGARPRLSVADESLPARARAHRDLQSLGTTRRRWWCACIRSIWRISESPRNW